MDDPECDLTAINAGSASADYMAYQFKYDTIHGKYGGSVETEGDFLIINGKKIPTSRCRDPAEAGWGKVRQGDGWRETTAKALYHHPT